MRASGSGWTCCAASTRTTARGSAGSRGATSARSSARCNAKGFLDALARPRLAGRRGRTTLVRTLLTIARPARGGGGRDPRRRASRRLLRRPRARLRLERARRAARRRGARAARRAAARVRARDRRRGAGPDADAAPHGRAARARRLADDPRRHRAGHRPGRPRPLGGRAPAPRRADEAEIEELRHAYRVPRRDHGARASAPRP